jgi:hypothetical protein
MTVNPHQLRLEQELVALRSKRVAIRRTLDAMAKGVRCGGDDYDQTIRARNLAMQFKATEARWNELHFLLNRDLPGPAVRLDVKPVATRGSLKFGTPMQNRRLADLRKTVEAGGYITRAMRGR